jgi:hypothetical protein
MLGTWVLFEPAAVLQGVHVFPCRRQAHSSLVGWMIAMLGVAVASHALLHVVVSLYVLLLLTLLPSHILNFE